MRNQDRRGAVAADISQCGATEIANQLVRRTDGIGNRINRFGTEFDEGFGGDQPDTVETVAEKMNKKRKSIVDKKIPGGNGGRFADNFDRIGKAANDGIIGAPGADFPDCTDRFGTNPPVDIPYDAE